MNWIKKHKKLCIVLVVLAVIVALIAAGISKGKKSIVEVKEESATVEKRTLMESISATGTFIASEEEQISSKATGVEVLSVQVEVGDHVAVGDVIAILDAKDIQKNLDNAKDSLQNTTDQSQRTRENAQRNLEQATKDRDDNLAAVDTDISDAYADWQLAETNYVDAKNAYDEAVATLAGAKENGANPGYAVNGNAYDANAFVSAQSRVDATKRQMDSDRRNADRLKRTYDDRVAQREDRIKRIWDTYQNQVDNYNDTMENTENPGETQQDRIDNLQEQLDDTVVRATASGLITVVNVEAGDTYNGGTIAVIDNVESFDVTTEVDEYDINAMKVGQEVLIKTNATGDDQLQGIVTKVAPMATGSVNSGALSGGGLGGLDFGNLMGGSSSFSSGSSNNDVTFTVTIHVQTNEPRLRMGMTAKLSIVTLKSENVISVPYNAVMSDDDDETFYVNKITGKDDEGKFKTKKVKVVKGIESDYYIEIIDSNLKEGDQVLLPKAEGGYSLEDLINNSGSMGGV